MSLTHFKSQLLIRGIKYNELLEFLKLTNGIISGSFITACIREDDQYSDIDIYYQNADFKYNICVEMNKIFITEPSKYKKEPIHNPNIDQRDPDALTMEYFHSVNKVDFVHVNCDPREFITKYADFNIGSAYFDGEFHIPFDIHLFKAHPECRLLAIGREEFEIVYDPWPSGETRNYDLGIWAQGINIAEQIAQLTLPEEFKRYQSKLEILPITANEEPRQLELSTRSLCAVENYKHIEEEAAYFLKVNFLLNIYKQARNMYIGESDEKGNPTDYRLLKTLYRCLKYISRGISVTNFHDYFV